MPRGGARVGAGRPAGVKDGQGSRRIDSRRVLSALQSGPKDTPLAFLMAVYQGLIPDATLNQKIQAATAAANFIHPKLSSVEVKSESTHTLSVQSDLAKALKDLAELARLRTIDGEAVEVLEPAALNKPDTVSAGQNVRIEAEPDIVTVEDGGLDLSK